MPRPTPKTSHQISRPNGRPKLLQWRSSAAVFVLLTGSFALASGQIDPGAEKILKNSMKQMSAQDEVSEMKMTIIEANGSKRTRELRMSRFTESKDQRVLARLKNPPDIRGTAFLSVINKSGEDQWIYLPSAKQTRRVVGGGKSNAGILGSELTYEDINPTALRSSSVSFLNPGLNSSGGQKTNAMTDIIEIRLAKGSSHYSRALIYMDKQHSLPVRLEYYDSKSTPAKEIAFSEYRNFHGVWRAQKVMVQNLRNHRKTEIALSSVKVNTGLSVGSFSPQALADNSDD